MQFTIHNEGRFFSASAMKNPKLNVREALKI